MSKFVDHQLRRDRQAEEGKQAWGEYLLSQEAMRDKTTRLRALRTAKANAIDGAPHAIDVE